jgi:superfamily II DNA or RNA helicase
MIDVLDIDLDAEEAPAWATSPAVVSAGGWTYRDYQHKAFAAIDEAFAEGLRRILLVLATGLGKTVVFTYIANKVVSAGGKVLIIAHSEELLDQAADKLRDSTGLEAVKEKAGERASPFDSVVVASVQTLSRASRLEGWAKDHFDLVIIDETHRAAAKSYMTIINHFTGRLLGVTATADRGDGQTLGHIYEKCVFEFGLLEAVRGGWLVRPIVKTLPLEIDLKGVKTSRTSQGSDYDLTEVSHRIEPFLGEIARLMAENTRDRRQGIIFMPSVATARMMRDALQGQGLNAEYVSGECADRADKIEAFKAGRTAILINAMLLIEGFDHDAVDWICVLRPTKIRGLYVQAVGRGTRTLKHIIPAINAAATAEERRDLIAKSAKPTLLILDFLWLTEKLDLIAPVSLVSKDPRVAQMAAKKGKDGDLLDIEELAQRDLLKSLEKAAAKNAGKKSKTLDPLALAVSLKAEDLAHYEPKEKWEYGAPSKAQLEVLAKHQIDVNQVHTAGMASQILNRLHLRRQQGLCSVQQMTFLEKLGVKDAAMKTADEAARIITKQITGWKHRKPSTSTARPAAHANHSDSLPLQ